MQRSHNTKPKCWCMVVSYSLLVKCLFLLGVAFSSPPNNYASWPCCLVDGDTAWLPFSSTFSIVIQGLIPTCVCYCHWVLPSLAMCEGHRQFSANTGYSLLLFYLCNVRLSLGKDGFVGITSFPPLDSIIQWLVTVPWACTIVHFVSPELSQAKHLLHWEKMGAYSLPESPCCSSSCCIEHNMQPTLHTAHCTCCWMMAT